MAEGEGQAGTDTAVENPAVVLLKKLDGQISSIERGVGGLKAGLEKPRNTPPPQAPPARDRSTDADDIKLVSVQDFELVYDRMISNEVNPETGEVWYNARVRRIIAHEHGRRLVESAKSEFGTTLREITSRSAATDQYPQLKDPKSEFSIKYEEQLGEMRADPAYSHLPTIELMAAREVGARMGVLPKMPGVGLVDESEEEGGEEMGGTMTRGGRPLPRRREPEKPSVASEADLRKSAAKMGFSGADLERIVKLGKDHAENDLGLRAIKNTFGL